MMETARPVIAKLIGGPEDGEEFTMSPHGSLGPPYRVQYMTDKGWLTYEQNCHDPMATWDNRESVTFYLVGHIPFDADASAR